MKATTSALIAIAAWSSSSLAAVSLNIVRNPDPSKLSRRHLAARATVTESLANNVTGGSYFAEVEVGTPPQKLLLALDTGSSDVWMLDSAADLCSDPSLQAQVGSGCDTVFDATKSSTLKVVDQGGFTIQYADSTGAQGDYITDTLSIGGVKITTLEMGLAYNVTLPTGLLGVGYDTNEASTSQYPSIIDTMVSQGLINSRAYSLYLDDLQASTGSIIFGGIDTDKYHGSLLQIPIVADSLRNGSKTYAEFSVPLTSFSITGQAGNVSNLTASSYNEPVILDSGTTLTYLPTELANLVYEQINAIPDETSGNVYVDCALRDASPKTTFNYGFGTGSSVVHIAVPVSELVFDLDGLFSMQGLTLPNLPFSNPCAFGIMSSSGGPNLLGDTFLRSAYVVYDLKNNLIALAQTDFNSTSSNIIEIKASATSIPDVSGAAASVAVTETASGAVGRPGSHTTTGKGGASATGSGSTGTGSSSSSGTSGSSSKSAGVVVVPTFDGRGLIVLALAGVGAVLGAGLVWA